LKTIYYRKMPRITLDGVRAKYERAMIVGFVLRESTSRSRPTLAISAMIAEPEPAAPRLNIAD
jgi:hypothetical protein